MCYPTILPTKQCQNKTALLTRCLIFGVLSFLYFRCFATPLLFSSDCLQPINLNSERKKCKNKK